MGKEEGRREDAADYLQERWWNCGDGGEMLMYFVRKRG